MNEKPVPPSVEKLYNIDSIGIANFIVTYPDGRKIYQYLTMHPFSSELFIGREEDLNAIEAEYLDNNRLLVLVNGEGGIGKTTLASKYWYKHAARYKHLAWLYADAGIGNALITLKDKLEVEFQQEDTIETQVQRITEALANLDAPCLIILDNANDDKDLKSHYTTLSRLRNCHILLTSRVNKLSDMKVHKVQPLTTEDAIKLFKHHYPAIQEDELPILKDVLKAVGHNTLVTEVLAKNLAVLNQYSVKYSLADLLHDLQSKGLLALKNKTIELVYGNDTLKESKPSDVIEAMYDLAKLNEDESHLLSNLSVLPAENIAYPLLVTILSIEEENLEEALKSLETKGWLEYRKDDNTFKISPVIQEVVRKKNEKRILDDCRTLIRNLTTGLNEENRHLGNYQQASTFAHLGTSLVQVLPVDDDVATLCQNIGRYHEDTGNLSLMQQTYQKMLDIQAALCELEPENADFKNGLAISYSKLGDTYTALGNLDRALEFFEKRSAFGEELYAAHPNNVSFKNGLAISYSKLGSTHTALGNLDRALDFFEKDIELSKELYAAYPNNVSYKNGLAISYSKLGETHTSLGNLDKALDFFEKDIELSKELYAAYPNNVSYKNGLAISYSKLGNTHTALGNLEKALEYFEKYNELEEELFAAYPNNVSYKNGLAISYSKLGDTHTALGNLENALEFFEKYNEFEEELYAAFPNNLEFKNGLAISYSKLGDTHTALGNLENALEFFEIVTKLFEELYAAYPNNVEFKNGLAISYEKLGGTYTALGNLDRALDFFEIETKLFEELYAANSNNVSFKNGLAISYFKLGCFYQVNKNDTIKAKAYFEKCYTLWGELTTNHPSYAEFQRNLKVVKKKLSHL